MRRRQNDRRSLFNNNEASEMNFSAVVKSIEAAMPQNLEDNVTENVLIISSEDVVQEEQGTIDDTHVDAFNEDQALESAEIEVARSLSVEVVDEKSANEIKSLACDEDHRVDRDRTTESLECGIILTPFDENFDLQSRTFQTFLYHLIEVG